MRWPFWRKAPQGSAVWSTSAPRRRQFVWAPLAAGAAEQRIAALPERATSRPRRFTPWLSRAITTMDWVLSPAILAVLGASAALAVAFWQFPFDLFIFRASWLIHPHEQEHLRLARNLAHHGTLYLRDPWFAQSPGHMSEDSSYVDGAFVPRAALLTYLIYAIPFLFNDTAWLFVTPFFTLAATVFAALIVLRRTASRWAAAITGILLLTTAPVLANASGVAFENIIAVGFLLAGVYALDRWTACRAWPAAALAGVAFALAGNVRPDVAPAGIAACACASALIVARARANGIRGQWTAIFGASLLTLAVGAGIAMAAASNIALYGSPFKSGYGGAAWQGSADGVAAQLLSFDPGAFARMARAFLFDIGKVQTVLLVFGVISLAARRTVRPGDVVLLATALFLAVLHLGHEGTYGGAQPNLLSSTPRYLQPLYVAGLVLGVEALWRWWSVLGVPQINVKRVLLASLVVLAASLSLEEAYVGSWAIPGGERLTRELRSVHEFAIQHPDAVFVGDVATKAIISGHTLIPRNLERPEDVAPFIDAELREGHDVYIVDLPRMRTTKRNPFYSGYIERLEGAGLHASPVRDAPPFLQVSRRAWDDADMSSFVRRSLAQGGTDQGLLNARLVVGADGNVRGWEPNGIVTLSPDQSGLLVRNDAQYGGVRQLIERKEVAGQIVSLFVAVHAARLDPARGVIVGLYEEDSLDMIVESKVTLDSGTTYLAIETYLPPDTEPLRFVIASERGDVGDLVVEGAILRKALIADALAEESSGR